MAAFADKNRKQAVELLQLMFHQEVAQGTDPLPELIVCLLEDEAGGVAPPPEVPLTTDEWLSWNQLAIHAPHELTWTLTDLLEAERMEVPKTRPKLLTWAANLVQLTLDRLSLE